MSSTFVCRVRNNKYIKTLDEKSFSTTFKKKDLIPCLSVVKSLLV